MQSPDTSWIQPPLVKATAKVGVSQELGIVSTHGLLTNC